MAIRPTPSFYDGSPERHTVTCPDCGHPADALIGNHGGPEVCAAARIIDGQLVVLRDELNLARAGEIIRHVASERRQFSSNSTRTAMDAENIPNTLRAKAFKAAIADGVMTPIGHVPSTEKPSQHYRGGGVVRLYRSEIYVGAKPVRR
ncbi:MAG TPA: hypothetical protein VGH54_21450 [Mycobacterium sp.]|jgi:hypothetical protein|uniref:hypothetical protein n=1 Tax=Mycobacterium sp. TaxID=1785 RepID=UPI002F3FB04A